MLSRREFVRATPLLLGAVASSSSSLRAGAAEPKPPEIGRSSRKPRAGDGVATLDVGSRGGLRVLQITDNHFFCGVKSGLAVTDGDTATERDWQEYVRIYKPDLIVSSGDLWHDNPGGRGQASLEWVLPKLERLGVPWAMCWGNHDQRIKDALDSNAGQGALKHLAQQWIDHIHDITPKCQHLPYDKRRGVYQFGDTKMLHGYSHGLTCGRKAASAWRASRRLGVLWKLGIVS